MRQACYKALSHILKKEDFTCEDVSSYKEGLALIEDFEHDCIIPDINLPGGTGLQLLQYLRDQHKEDGVIIISARDSPDEPLTCYYVTLPFGRRHCCLPKNEYDLLVFMINNRNRVVSRQAIVEGHPLQIVKLCAGTTLIQYRCDWFK